MEGDLANLPEIVRLKHKYNASIMVDEAHGLGVFGKQGRGVCDHFGLTHEVDLIMGTFSKSLASIGGFIAADSSIINWIKHNSRTYIFSASATPAATASAMEALHILKNEPERLEKLWAVTNYALKRFKEAGFEIGDTESPIIPLYVRDTEKALEKSAKEIEKKAELIEKKMEESKRAYGTEGSENMTHFFTIGNERASSHYNSKGEMHIMFCGDDKIVKSCEKSLLFDSDHLTFVTPKGKKVTASKDGIKVNGKEHNPVVKSYTKVNQQIRTATYIFSVNGVKVHFQQGPDIDMSEVTEELVRNIFGTTSKIFDAAGKIIQAAGSAIGSASNGISIQGSVNYQRPKNTAIYKNILAQAKLSEPNKGATTATKTGTEAWATNPKVYHYPVKGKIVKGYSHDGVYILFYGSEKDVDCCIRHFAIDQNGYVQTTTRKGNKFLITKYGIKSLFESSKNKVVEIERYAEVRAESEFGEQNLLMGTFDDVEYRYLKGPSDSPVMKEEIAKILETSYVQNIFPQKNV